MEGRKPYRPYHLRQACYTCGQLNNVIMWASLRFPLLSYLSAKQTTKYLILCARSQTDCNFRPAVFLNFQWLPLAVGFVYTLQRKSIFYAISMLANMCLLVSCYTSKLVGTMFVQICDIQPTIIFKPMMSYHTDQAANVASCHSKVALCFTNL